MVSRSMLSLFDRVVEESGLAPMLARSAIMRACIRAGVRDPERMSRSDLKLALSQLYQCMELYLPIEELIVRFERLVKLSKLISIPPSFDLSDPALEE